MIHVAFFDTKPYDREYFQRSLDAAPDGSEKIQPHYLDFRLSAESLHAAKGAQAVCLFVSDVADRANVEALAALGVKHIALRCAGFNNIDLTAIRAAGLTATRVPAYSPHAVAEYSIGLLLTLNRKIHRAYNRVREQNFSLNGLVGADLYGKTAGIIGTGKIGKLVAQIFRGFGVTVLAYDPHPDLDWARENKLTYGDLNTVLGASDFISLHAPLTPETEHLLRAETLAHCKPGALIVNTSRGKLIDSRALVSALKTGRIGGVALDVYEEEEGIFFEDHSGDVLLDDVLTRLITFPNVLITSHQAFLTAEALSEIARVTTTNILNVASNQPPLPGTAI